jgi:spore maturation protein CgeB
MYEGYLDSFYNRFTNIQNLTYKEHLDLLLNDTTEFVASYNSAFRRLGVDSNCIIANDSDLQKKWGTEFMTSLNRNPDILYNQVAEYQPDILWIDNLTFTDKVWLSEIKKVRSIKLVVAYHCSPYNSKIIERLHCVDFVITCTPGLMQEMTNNGIKAYMVYHGFDNNLLSRIKKDSTIKKHDLIFSGSLTSGGKFHSERIAFIEELLKTDVYIDLFVNLESKYKIKVKQMLNLIYILLSKLKINNPEKSFPILGYGASRVSGYSKELLTKKQPPVYGITMYDLFCNSKIVLNYHGGISGNYAGNMRLFEVTGVGSCLLTDNKKNMNDLFVAGNEIITYDNPQDCIQKASWLLDHEAEREEIALAGQQKTLTSHTVEDRCRTMIDILSKELR